MLLCTKGCNYIIAAFQKLENLIVLFPKITNIEQVFVENLVSVISKNIQK